VCGEPSNLDCRIIGVVIPIFVVLGIDVLLDDTVVEERKVSCTLSFVNSEMGYSDMGIFFSTSMVR
jgi:hypothetical protein